MTERDTTSDVSTLCQQCGLCCDGSLFTFLPVTAADRPHLEQRGARIEERRDGRLALQLPCAVLCGTRCGAYEQRPARCREYICELAKAVKGNERSLEAASAIVDEAKALRAALEQRLEPKAPNDTRSVLQRAHQVEATEPDDAHFKAVRSQTRELEALLHQHFIGQY